MKKEDLKVVIDLHLKWLNHDINGNRANLRDVDLRRADLRDVNLCGADLRRADLRDVDLRRADLRGADLRRADLRRADLRGADLDFGCFPLWCGSFNIKVGDRFIFQLLFHLLKLDYVGKNPLIKRMMKMESLIKLANKSHLIDNHKVKKIQGEVK